jgi:hypothetical protein
MAVLRKLAKLLLSLIGILLFVLVALATWMRTGEEAPVDYSSMAPDIGQTNVEQNGFTYMREFLKSREAKFPEEFGWEVDYRRRENWDEKIFASLIEDNRAFLVGLEEAFDRPHFN